MEATFFNGHCDVEVGDWVRLVDEPRFELDGTDRRPSLKSIDQIRVIQDVWREWDGTPDGELRTSVRFLFAIDGCYYRREEFEPVAYRNGQPWPRGAYG